MTTDEIIESLKATIKNELGFPAFVLPQKGVNNTARIDLQFQDIKPNGDNNEKLIFLAEYATNGTHIKWLTQTVKLMRKLHDVEGSHMLLQVNSNVVLRAYWIRQGTPRWVYPNESESSMPAEYILQYRVEIDIPTRLLED